MYRFRAVPGGIEIIALDSQKHPVEAIAVLKLGQYDLSKLVGSPLPELQEYLRSLINQNEGEDQCKT